MNSPFCWLPHNSWSPCSSRQPEWQRWPADRPGLESLQQRNGNGCSEKWIEWVDRTPELRHQLLSYVTQYQLASNIHSSVPETGLYFSSEFEGVVLRKSIQSLPQPADRLCGNHMYCRRCFSQKNHASSWGTGLPALLWWRSCSRKRQNMPRSASPNRPWAATKERFYI